MSRIVWDAVGTRRFEAGVDRGVLYLEDNTGVPWPGLVSVTEKSEGGMASSDYLDGVKIRNYFTEPEFQGVIEAYTYPEEFTKFEGQSDLGNGLFATSQRRNSFGFSYRSLVGDDVDMLDAGYKIHLIYNAQVLPASRSHATVAETVDIDNFVWEVRTLPPLHSGLTPTAHFVIDSRQTPVDLLADIEDILYGTEAEEPRLPLVDELVFFFENYNSDLMDARYFSQPQYELVDAGYVGSPRTETYDGGGPNG